MKRVEGMAGALKMLGEQAELLNQEIVTMTVRPAAARMTRKGLKLGVIPLESPADDAPAVPLRLRTICRGRWAERVELVVGLDFAQTIKDLEDGVTELAFLTPTTYIEAQEKVRRSAPGEGASQRRALYPFSDRIQVRGRHRRLEDIKGKRFAFGDRMSTSSYLIPRAMLAEAGSPDWTT